MNEIEGLSFSKAFLEKDCYTGSLQQNSSPDFGIVSQMEDEEDDKIAVDLNASKPDCGIAR